MKKLFAVAWRLAILTIPWQTRWFLDAKLAGWPWEQGRISIYVSWGLMLATIVIGMIGRGAWYAPSDSDGRSGRTPSAPTSTVIAIAILLFVSALSIFRDPRALAAIVQWWVQIGLLMSFVFVVRRQMIPWKSFATWFVIALLPQAILGLVQYATQRVWGATILGIATQLPENAGVSVVEYGLYRVLRIYGGFPHPNIFGGWLFVGIITALLLAARSETKMRALFAIITSSVFSIALLLTYSRSAWIAVIVGTIVLVGAGFSRPDRSAGGRGNPAPTQFLFVALFMSLFAVGIVGFSQRETILARTDSSARLEVKSFDERAQSLRDGIRLFKAHPLIGTGPNAELLSLVPTTGNANAPLEPSHNVFLLILVDLGLVGFVLLGVFFIYLFRIYRLSIFFLALVPIALFDHYLWSYWSGQTLVMCSILLFRHSDEP